MLIETKPHIAASESTEQAVFHSRRKFIQAAAAAAVVAGAGAIPAYGAAPAKKFGAVPIGPYSADLQPTEFKYIANYTNYYEFSTGKEGSTQLAQDLPIQPWSVAVEGEVEKPGVYNLEDILKQNPLQERIYRFRCVEAWAMVVPWIGFPLGVMLKQFKPISKAKFVQFTTLYDPKFMPGQRLPVLDWPYVEGLRIDEAMHPLAFLATGMYDDALPKQNGAPLRLVVPWKYGFKSIKAIVKIRFQETMPETAWHKQAPREYGFYANVNPNVAHPRWSQSRERILGASIFTPKRKTEMFNGYAEEVASLYAGMNLQKNY